MNDKAIIAGWMLDVRFKDIEEIERERDRVRRAAQLLLDDIIHEMWWYGYDPSEHKIYVENYTLHRPSWMLTFGKSSPCCTMMDG